MRAFPGIAGALALSVIGYLAFLALVSVYIPLVLPALDALAIVTMGIAYWICRPAFGVSRGLPPGSLSPVSSVEAILGFSQLPEQPFGVVGCGLFNLLQRQLGMDLRKLPGHLLN